MANLKEFIKLNRNINNYAFFRKLADGKVIVCNNNFGTYIFNNGDIVNENIDEFQEEKERTKQQHDTEAKWAQIEFEGNDENYIDVKAIEEDPYDKTCKVLHCDDRTIGFFTKTNFNFLSKILGPNGKYRFLPSEYICMYETDLGKGYIKSEPVYKEVSKETEGIIRLYKSFYGKIPDFRNPNSLDEVYAMIYLSKRFNLYNPIEYDLYNYSIDYSSKVPSRDLRGKIEELKDLGPIDYWYYVDENDKKIFSFVNRSSAKLEKMQDLIDDDTPFGAKTNIIARTMFSQEHKVTGNTNKLSMYTGLSKQEVEKGLEYIKKIRQNIK